MSEITVERLTKRFGETVALDAVSLNLDAGSFTALLGPSGCGKTTLLRLIAGFEAPSEGSVRFGGELIASPGFQVPPEKRSVGVVFQSYALWPHMDVHGNVAYPLKTRGRPSAEIRQRVGAVLEMVGLDGFESRRIDELSGGQRQRVALARCLVADSRIILFDEPLANLDMHLRAAMVEAFRDIHRRSGATIVYVTHDQAEALALADRVAVMSSGRVLQFGSPQDVYRSPAAPAVAGFVGRGAIVSGTLLGADAGVGEIEIGGQRVRTRTTGRAAGPAKVLLRPEHLALAGEGVAARVAGVTYRGPVYEVRLDLPSGEQVMLDAPAAPAVGDQVRVAVSDAWVIPEG
jgi:iron(III) transport system ATP-binding protein